MSNKKNKGWLDEAVDRLYERRVMDGSIIEPMHAREMSLELGCSSSYAQEIINNAMVSFSKKICRSWLL